MISWRSAENQRAGTATAIMLLVGLISIAAGLTVVWAGNPETILVGVIATGLLAATIISPETMVPIVLFVWGFGRQFLESSNLVFGNLLGQSLTASRGLGMLVILGVVLSLFLRQTWIKVLDDPLVSVYVFFALWVTCNGLVLGIARTDSYNFIIRFLSGVAIFVIYYVSFSDGRAFRRSAVWMTASGCIASIITITQYILNQVAPALADQIFRGMSKETSDIAGISVDRAVGSIGGPFATGVVLLALLTYAMYLWRTENGQTQKRAAGAAIVLISLGIFATVTRTALVSLVFLLMGWQFGRRQQAQNRAVVLVFSCFIVLAGVMFVGPGSIMGRTADVLLPSATGLASGDFANGRWVLWQSVLRVFLGLSPERWLLGGGLGFSIRASLATLGYPFIIHNEYLWILVDVGLVGVVLYAMFAVGVWQRLRLWLRDYRQAPEVWEGVFAFLLLFAVYHGMVAMFWNYSGSISGSWFYLSFLGSALGLTKAAQRRTFRGE